MIEIPAPDLSRAPDPAEFERVVRQGLGRAILHVQRHGIASYREIVLQAILNDWSYDADLEETRERYLLDLIEQSGEKAFFRDRLVAALRDLPRAEERGSKNRSPVQVVRLAYLIAQQGDEEAARTLREIFLREPAGFPDAGILVKLDGMDGLLFAARGLGEALLGGDLDCYDEPMTDIQYASEEIIGDWSSVVEQLAQMSDDQRIAAFVAASKEREQPRVATGQSIRDQLRGMPYERFSELIPERDDGYPAKEGLRRSWGKWAGNDDFIKAATDFLALPHADPWLQSCFLDVFAFRTFPLDPGRLVELVRQGDFAADRPYPSDAPPRWSDRLAFQAAQALTGVADPRVREAGLALLPWPRWAESGVDLLVGNYRRSDLPLIEAAFLSADEPFRRHGIGSSIQDLCEANSGSELARVLVHLYEKNPCGHCKEVAVRTLLTRNAVPTWLADECRFDANDEIRSLVAGFSRRPS